MRFKWARAMLLDDKGCVPAGGRWSAIHPVGEDICTCGPYVAGATICDNCVEAWDNEGWLVEVIEDGEWVPVKETICDFWFHLDSQFDDVNPDGYWFVYAGRAPNGEFLMHHCSYRAVHRDECDNVKTEFDACLDESLGSAIVRMILIDVLPEKPSGAQMIEILQNSPVFSDNK